MPAIPLPDQSEGRWMASPDVAPRARAEDESPLQAGNEFSHDLCSWLWPLDERNTLSRPQ